MRPMTAFLLAVILVIVVAFLVRGIGIGYPGGDDTRPSVDCYQRAEDAIEGLMPDRTPSERRTSLIYTSTLYTCLSR